MTTPDEPSEPTVAIGHVSLRVSDLEAACAFYSKLGMKHVAHGGVLEIMQLRGGTHLLLFRARGKPRKGDTTSRNKAGIDAPTIAMVVNVNACSKAVRRGAAGPPVRASPC